MVYRPNVDEQLCFVLMPFTDFHMQYFSGIIGPAVEGMGLKAQKADDIYGTAPIMQDIWQAIWSAKVVIADVTAKNPNVNYELGLCHALGVPTILITQSMDDVPFDYKQLRCIVYNTRDYNWQEKLKTAIAKTIEALFNGGTSTDHLHWPYDTSRLKVTGQIGPFVPAIDMREPMSQSIKQGFESIAKSYGVHGTSVLVYTQFGSNKSYRSGAAIASAFNSADPLARIGLEQIKAISREVAAAIGDGTKTAAMLFCEMVLEGFRQLNSGVLMRDLVRDMDIAVELATKYLHQESVTADGAGILSVATTAALGDIQSGQLILNAIERAGKDGVITIEDSPDLSTTLSVQEGMYFHRGYLSRKFITDESRQLAVLDNPYILLLADKLTSMNYLLPLLEQVALSRRPLLLIADDVEGEALATLIANHQRATLLSVAVRNPQQALRYEVLEDIAFATGGTVISHASLLAQVRLSQLGEADRAEVSSSTTWVIGVRGDQQHVQSRAAGLRQQISVSSVDFERARLEERLAKLVGATVALRIGGASVVERDERKYRIETALHSSRWAISEGVLPGGGIALWRVGRRINDECRNQGGRIVAVALREPLLAQIRNARCDHGRISSELEAASGFGVGFNSLKRAVSNLMEDGVLDSSHVLVRGLQVAFAHARNTLQTGDWEIPSETSSLKSVPEWARFGSAPASEPDAGQL
jgi:chaperonin GroEL